MPDAWKKIESRHQGAYEVFDVRQDRRRSPRTGRDHTFYVIESDDWVNVIPITPDGHIVFVRQYRHGTDEVTLEVPGGLVDPDDPSPEVAARREMQEETGYDADTLIPIGAVAPNPAIQNNHCHTFLALNAQATGTQQLDGVEDIEVVLVPLEAVPELVVSGRITHALVVVAFYLYDQYRRAEAQRTAGEAA